MKVVVVIVLTIVILITIYFIMFNPENDNTVLLDSSETYLQTEGGTPTNWLAEFDYNDFYFFQDKENNYFDAKFGGETINQNKGPGKYSHSSFFNECDERLKKFIEMRKISKNNISSSFHLYLIICDYNLLPQEFVDAVYDMSDEVFLEKLTIAGNVVPDNPWKKLIIKCKSYLDENNLKDLITHLYTKKVGDAAWSSASDNTNLRTWLAHLLIQINECDAHTVIYRYLHSFDPKTIRCSHKGTYSDSDDVGTFDEKAGEYGADRYKYYGWHNDCEFVCARLYDKDNGNTPMASRIEIDKFCRKILTDVTTEMQSTIDHITNTAGKWKVSFEAYGNINTIPSNIVPVGMADVAWFSRRFGITPTSCVYNLKISSEPEPKPETPPEPVLHFIDGKRRSPRLIKKELDKYLSTRHSPRQLEKVIATEQQD